MLQYYIKLHNHGLSSLKWFKTLYFIGCHRDWVRSQKSKWVYQSTLTKTDHMLSNEKSKNTHIHYLIQHWFLVEIQTMNWEEKKNETSLLKQKKKKRKKKVVYLFCLNRDQMVLSWDVKLS